jgi:hypothetical protein
MRTLAKYLLSIVGALLAFAALSGTSIWLLVGTADHATTTVVSVLSNEVAGRAAGSALVDALAEAADPVVRARIEGESGPLADAAAAGLRASEAAISSIIHALYWAIEDGSKAVIDLKPVYAKVLAEMHRVDGSIPVSPDDAIDASGSDAALNLEVDGSTLGMLRTALAVIGGWWILALAALGFLVLAGLCDRRGPVRRWRVTGISMAIPSGVLLVISLLAGSAVAGVGDSDTSGLIDSAVSVARGTLVLVTGITFIVAIAVIIVTLVARRPAKAEELPAPTPDEAQPDSPPPALSGSAAPPSVTPPDPS